MTNPQYLSGQPDKRRHMRFTDQHGRKWGGIIEIKTGQPAGPIQPLDFNPPLDVPQHFLRFDPLEPNIIEIDYAAWIRSLEDAKHKWNQRLIDRAQRLYGDQAGKYVKKPSQELLEITGPEPHPVEPVQAAAAGNRWVLGLTPIRPKWADAFFPAEGELRQRRTATVSAIDSDTAEAWREQFPDADGDSEEE